MRKQISVDTVQVAGLTQSLLTRAQKSFNLLVHANNIRQQQKRLPPRMRLSQGKRRFRNLPYCIVAYVRDSNPISKTPRIVFGWYEIQTHTVR